MALCATALSLLIGLPIGYALAQRRVPLKAAWEGIVLLPLVLPPTVMGYYLLVTVGRQGPLARAFTSLTGREMPSIAFTWEGAVLAACVVSIPLLIRAAQIAFSDIDRELVEMARTQGAAESQIVRFILLPLARRGLLAGVGLTFARALGDFGATLMIGGNIPGETRTMPLAVYDAVNAGDDHTALVFVLLLSGVCLLFSLLASAYTLRSER